MSVTIPTSEKLAKALEEAGLNDMAQKAREGYYDDFKSPLTAPIIQLVEDLHAVGGQENLIELAKLGEFDATKEESDAWFAGPEGQAVFRNLTSGKGS